MLQICPSCSFVTMVEGLPLPYSIICSSCKNPISLRGGSSTKGRITLTRTHLKLPEIEELVVLLTNIASDGVLEYEELQKLTDWLNNHNKLDVPAVRYLVDLMVQICEDGQIADGEIVELQLAIERILPKEFRTTVAEARKKAYYDQPATERQLDAIQSFTHERPTSLNKRQASETLDQLYSNPPPSNRQIMLLRFWNRMDLANASRHEISDWIDEFTNADNARWMAWSLFKEENGDDGSQRDPSFVPIGIGESYLERIYQRYGF